MLFERMMRAARADVNVYEEVEADTSATTQAATVVAIVAVCTGIGSAIAIAMNRDPNAGSPIMALIGGIITAFIGWVIWSYITYWVGTSVFKGTATPGEMLRTIGFAQSPQALNILAFVPILGGFIGFLVGLWSLYLAIVAIRQALDFSTGKAVGTALIGFVVYLVLALIMAVIFGVGAAATGALR
jgi:hypothetical protein